MSLILAAGSASRSLVGTSPSSTLLSPRKQVGPQGDGSVTAPHHTMSSCRAENLGLDLGSVLWWIQLLGKSWRILYYSYLSVQLSLRTATLVTKHNLNRQLIMSPFSESHHSLQHSLHEMHTSPGVRTMRTKQHPAKGNLSLCCTTIPMSHSLYRNWL